MLATTLAAKSTAVTTEASLTNQGHRQPKTGRRRKYVGKVAGSSATTTRNRVVTHQLVLPADYPFRPTPHRRTTSTNPTTFTTGLRIPPISQPANRFLHADDHPALQSGSLAVHLPTRPSLVGSRKPPLLVSAVCPTPRRRSHLQRSPRSQNRPTNRPRGHPPAARLIGGAS